MRIAGHRINTLVVFGGELPRPELSFLNQVEDSKRLLARVRCSLWSLTTGQPNLLVRLKVVHMVNE